MWARLKTAWDTYRHAAAARTLLDVLGFWKYVILGVAVLSSTIGTPHLHLSLAWSIILGLAFVALLLLICGLAVAVYKVSEVLVFPELQEKDIKPKKNDSGRRLSNGWVVAIVGVIILGAIGWFTSIYHMSEAPKPLPSPKDQTRQVTESATGPVDIWTKTPQKSASKGEERSDRKKPQTSVSQAVGSVTVRDEGIVSINQQGGQIARTIINNGPERLGLSQDQQRSIMAAMSTIGGNKNVPVLIEVKGAVTGETHSFALALKSVLIRSGFINTEVNECLCTYGGCSPLPGISFQAGSNRRLFTNTLIDALYSVGIRAVQSPPCGRSGEPDEMIVMVAPL